MPLTYFIYEINEKKEEISYCSPWSGGPYESVKLRFERKIHQ